MKTLTIPQIKELENNEPIQSFEGLVTKVYEQKTFPSQFGGEFNAQNLIIEQDGQKVQATWTGEDDVSVIEGTRRRFESILSEKHGWQGIKWQIRKADGQIYKSIRLTPSCKIRSVGESNGGGGIQQGSSNALSSASREDTPSPSPEISKDVYWLRKDQRDVEAVKRMGRAHSQEMAIRWIDAARATLNDQGPDFDQATLRRWTDYFQRDLENAPSEPTENEESEVPF